MILYITYDGILEPLGQSQVLRYLERLAVDHEIWLISFEKPRDWARVEEREAMLARIRKAGIHWKPLRYHKWPSALATAWDILQGLVVGSGIVLRRKVRIVHARSYVPGVIALALKNIFRLKFVFDMRGFWADERVDAGAWVLDCAMYKLAKWFERRFLLAADMVVSLTHAAVVEMRRFDYLQDHMPSFTVIPTCADLTIFRPLCSSENFQRSEFIFGWVGTVRRWYQFDEGLLLFKSIQSVRGNARLRILNRGEHTYIRDRLSANNVNSDQVDLYAVQHDAMPEEIRKMDAGIFIIQPYFSNRASSPTKLAEFLGCGVPCLCNDSISDITKIIVNGNVGVILRSFDDSSREAAVRQLLALVDDPETPRRCVATAAKHFSLTDGVAAYDRIYRDLSGSA